MRAAWLAWLLFIPAVAGLVVQNQEATMAVRNQEGPIELVAGDVGVATIGVSKHSAIVDLAAFPLITQSVLEVNAASATWNAHAELIGFTGWAGLDTVTLSFVQGVAIEPQVKVVAGAEEILALVPVTLSLTQPIELILVGAGTGTLSVEVVLVPTTQPGPELRYQVDLTV